jgi:hypothetical protein
VDGLKEISREYKFACMYYDWVCECLEEDKKYEELAFFKLGVDLMVRQKELTSIKFSQIEFPYVKDIQVIKVVKIPVEPTEDDDREYKYRLADPSFYEHRIISRDTYDSVNKLWSEGKEKIFEKSAMEYSQSIKESIGDSRFDGHMIRGLGSYFKTEIYKMCEEWL